jgi:spermidine synthase
LGPRPAALLIYVAFTASGFAGLIYESVWSHYLGLFLGHAAYAQALVLAIFMGGLAVGAWLASRWQPQALSLLAAYAVVELLIGLFGLFFHELYASVTEFVQRSLLGLADPGAAAWLKAAFGAALILPQTLLLGMTFPYLTVAALRGLPVARGRLVGSLYFLNSLGAALGALVTGFVLIAEFGLPGAVRAAGGINIAVAVMALAAARGLRESAVATALPTRGAVTTGIAGRVLLVVALLTGWSSLLYELAWIRMLTMVLGSSVHSFELMLSAFILGLALGGAFIRKRLDRSQDPLLALAAVQVCMGVLALTTIAFYDFSFDLMALLLQALSRSQAGYIAFLLASHAIASFIMLPTTLCAGMTLPLITHVWMNEGGGEASVGRTYAANTVGAVLGVVSAMLILIPWLGLKWTLSIGALMDLGLGVLLLYGCAWNYSGRRAAVGLACAGAFTLAALLGFDLDPRKLASGVFRYGTPVIASAAEVIYRRDGRTASISVVEYDGTYRVLSTNGKPDASIEFDPIAPAANDERTQVLTAMLPMMVRPDARRIAVVGFGSGTTSNDLLSFDAVERVTTIEIEPAVIEGARHFLPRVAATYEDPRSHIVSDDARTYLPAHRNEFDLIIAEPSNPWVSGVASLFTREFYALIKQALKANGALAQWIQLYEMDCTLLGAVFKALASEFPQVEVFEMADGNFLFIAAVSGRLETDAEVVFAAAERTERLDRIAIKAPDDLLALRVGDAHALAPLFERSPIAANSDYYPVLERGAARARFLKQDAYAVAELAVAGLPLVEMLDGESGPARDLYPTSTRYRRPHRYVQAHDLAAALGESGAGRRVLNDVPAELRYPLEYLRGAAAACGTVGDGLWVLSLVSLAESTLPFLSADTGRALVDRIIPQACAGRSRAWRDLLIAVASRDATALSTAGGKLLDHLVADAEDARFRYVLKATLLGYAAQQAHAEGAAMWESLPRSLRADLLESLEVQLLIAHLGIREGFA